MIETSRAMKSRSEGVNKVMEDLIGSGIGGQLRRGDSIAVWTYNSELYAGRFPLQQWTPETQKAVAVRILGFLKDQTYEKSASLQKSLLAMDRVIKNSEFITIILVSDGSQQVAGTPFDAQINNLYKSWDKEQQKARMPFVTVLQAIKGKITHYTVTSAPWPVEMPPLPNELLFATTNSPPKTDTKTNAAPPVAVRKPPIGQPLIISGKKPPAQEPSRTNDTTVATANQQSPGTNVAAAKMEMPAPAPVTPNTLAAPTPNPVVSSQAIPQNAQAPTSTSEPLSKSEIPKAEPKVSSEPATAATGTQATPTPGSNSTEPMVVASLGSTNPATPPLQVQEQQQPANQQEPQHSRTRAQSVVVPSQPFLAGKLIWIAGLASGLVVLILLMLRTRRNRSTAAASSLITRSFERERKP
jgi:hypothetical protein